MLPLTVPQQATAVRPSWSELPAEARAIIETRCGADVVAAESMGAGFTPGFASRLRLADGRRVFVKAADEATRGLFADSYREEIGKLRTLPDAIPAARLLWSHDADGWVALALEDIDGQHPARPWRPDQLESVLRCLDRTAELLTPAPDGYPWPPLQGFLLPDPSYWEEVRANDHAPEWLRPHLAECDRLALLGDEAMAGDTVVHADVRDDNVLIDGDGNVWLCDWNWPLRGNPAIDTVCILLSASGDGLDADTWIARCETTRWVDPEAIDGMLSLLASYFWAASHRPSPETSPWLRTHQRWWAEAASGWLAKRRGWR
jgi:Phosphotransferase enzyme family